MKQYTTEHINQALHGTLIGSPTIMITGVEQISEATINQLTFIGEKKYIKLWDQSHASAAIVNDILDIEPGKNRALVRVADADLALASALQLFEPELPKCEPGIHSTAV
ncbi:MAG: UDP-3-O-(3-hydroxymyristoyl)glucosamine N-acyltransferase, partial [Desulfobacteraceae bacterium]